MSNILIAGKGYIYTDGITYGHTITLGTCDSAENWYEITEAEHEKILKEKMEASK
ncbi:MAG: hypothetical protein IJ039_04965 [Clostridia bacterium]|nr:hypothetical protein [Clostridia bacterium]